MAVESVSICTNPTKSAAGCSAAAVSVSVSAAVWAADWMWRRAFSISCTACSSSLVGTAVIRWKLYSSSAARTDDAAASMLPMAESIAACSSSVVCSTVAPISLLSVTNNTGSAFSAAAVSMTGSGTTTTSGASAAVSCKAAGSSASCGTEMATDSGCAAATPKT